MKFKRIRKRSDKGKLRARIGSLHFKILKFMRGDTCEICGKLGKDLGRFHILRVGKYPRLEFYDRNVLIAGWFCCHFPYHHYGADDPRCEFIVRRLKVLRGENYRDELVAIHEIAPVLKKFQLQMIHESMKQAVKEAGI